MNVNGKPFSILIVISLLFALPVQGIASATESLQQTTGVVLHVKPGANGSCTSWTDACELQTAIFNAVTGDRIWVASGTYRPTTSFTRTATFQLKSGVAIYGGFPAPGGLWEQRDWVANPSVLSGDISVQGSNADNSYHVVTGSGVDATAILDGFTITAGKADGSAPHNSGGGLYINAGSPTIINVTFSTNTAAEFGGGIYNNSSGPTLIDLIFSSNSAKSGGGMYNDASNPYLTDITFSTNTASENGGGILNLNSNPSLTGVTFSGNKAEGTSISAGGGMYNSASSPSLTNVTFSNNITYLFGPDGGGGMFNFQSNPTLNNVTFSGNSASRGAGMSNKESSPTLIGGSFTGNTAYSEGGGMFNSSSTPSLKGVTFSTNKTDGSVVGKGGGMYNSSSSPILSNVTFSDNTSPYQGGGMYNSGGSPMLTDCSFTSNTAKGGGGMYNSGSNPLLSSITFTANNANGNEYNSGGGGISNSGGSPTLIDVTFTNNATTKYGGGMLNTNSSPFLKDILFIGNSSVMGGGMSNSGGIPSLINVTFAGNISGYGGGMSNGDCNATLNNVTFSSNSATYHGGGIYNSTSSPTLTNVTISGNSAAFGGGMYIGDDRSGPTLTNVTFFGNSATYESGYGGGLLNYGANTVITNAIFWGNTPDQIPFNNVTVSYSIIQNGYTGTGNISADPLLGTLANNGGSIQTHALGEGSPAIDAASPTLCPGVDARGYSRPVDGDGVNGARCDMGSYEYASSVANFSLTVNLVGGGSVVINPAKTAYAWGEVVTLTASDGPDWIFDGWSGDASGTVNPLRVPIYENTIITATFWLDALLLSTSVSPVGTGTVTRSPDISTYHTGDLVTLTALPSPGWSFTSWTGEAGGSTNPLTVTMTANKSITANFTFDEYFLSISVNPPSMGSVAISPLKPLYNYGDVVTLTPTPISGWHFSSWSGDGSGIANPLKFTINGDTNITANFSDIFIYYLPLVIGN